MVVTQAGALSKFNGGPGPHLILTRTRNSLPILSVPLRPLLLILRISYINPDIIPFPLLTCNVQMRNGVVRLYRFFFTGPPLIDNFPVFLSSALIIFGIYHYYYNLLPLCCTVVCYFKYNESTTLPAASPFSPFDSLPGVNACTTLARANFPGDKGNITCY